MRVRAGVSQRLVYLAAPEAEETQVAAMARQAGCSQWFPLQRRGVALGWVGTQIERESGGDQPLAWAQDRPVLLAGALADQLERWDACFQESASLVEGILDGNSCEQYLDEAPYASRLLPEFQLAASLCHEDDDQEIEFLEFEVPGDGDEPQCSDIWLKVAWLSFDESDPSLRFRFSFGLENYEDVAADAVRQHWSSELARRVFPESDMIVADERLQERLCQVLGVPQIRHVERIIYFNAAGGGAQFHHDVERGHLGVIFAQATGHTAWLALSKPRLMDEIAAYGQSDARDELDAESRQRLCELAADRASLSEVLESADDLLELVLNRSPGFCRRLMDAGHGYVLAPGDVLLLPQRDLEHAVWHTVFCLGDVMGEGLSFAMRTPTA